MGRGDGRGLKDAKYDFVSRLDGFVCSTERIKSWNDCARRVEGQFDRVIADTS